LPVDGLVLEAAPLPGPVDLRGEQVGFLGGVRPAAVDGRLLPALYDPDYFGDQPVLVEGIRQLDRLLRQRDSLRMCQDSGSTGALLRGRLLRRSLNTASFLRLPASGGYVERGTRGAKGRREALGVRRWVFGDQALCVRGAT